MYGSEHDDPAASLQPGHHYREQTGGPLDGELIEVTGWPEEEITTGAYLITPHNTYGPGGRASYAFGLQPLWRPVGAGERRALIASPP